MKTKIIEATNNGLNWGKFMLCRPDTEFSVPSSIEGAPPIPLLRQRGWGPEHLWVLDIETGEGACFLPRGLPSADLNKHRIWVCPLYEPFLEWLYKQDLTDLDALPSVVNLPKAEFAMAGYRRPGPASGAHPPGPEQKTADEPHD